MNELVFGNPLGIPEGKVMTRPEMKELGYFTQPQKGIDGRASEGATAIILSGGYDNNLDRGDHITYTGEGGRLAGQTEITQDQTWTKGNKALRVSKIKGLPIRVFRGSKHSSKYSPSSGYRYAGLYKIAKTKETRNKKGVKLILFELEKLEPNHNEQTYSPNPVIEKGSRVLLKAEGRDPKWYSLGEAKPDAALIPIHSDLGRRLFGKMAGEKIEMTMKYEILEVK